MLDIQKNKPRPFLQWVGGKRIIAEQLLPHIPNNLNNYYEPFLGGGALFFQAKNMFKKCYLSDINLELITTYSAVKKNPEIVGALLEEHNSKHSKEYYYQTRNVNNSNHPDVISARLLYLTRYAYKGIYRLNRKGNVASSFAHKTYKTSRIHNRLKECSSSLKDASIYAMDFSFIEPEKDDFVYFDPPYHKAGEKFYTRLSFDEKEQIRLKDFIDTLNDKGVKIMVSNSNTQFIKELYKNYNINTIDTKYSLHKKREKLQELMITNY